MSMDTDRIYKILNQTGLIVFAEVHTFTDTNNFASIDLIGRGDDYFNGWYVFCVHDAGGAGASPQGKYRAVTDYVSATGTITHDAFLNNLAVGDKVMLVHPKRDDILAVDDKVSGILVKVPFYFSGDTVVNSSINLFEFDALGSNIVAIEISFYLPLHATATFTPGWYKTRPNDLVTFTQEVIPAIAAIATPGANAYYRYVLEGLAQGLQGQFRLAQSNNAPAVTIDATAIVSMIL